VGDLHNSGRFDENYFVCDMRVAIGKELGKGSNHEKVSSFRGSPSPRDAVTVEFDCRLHPDSEIAGVHRLRGVSTGKGPAPT